MAKSKTTKNKNSNNRKFQKTFPHFLNIMFVTNSKKYFLSWSVFFGSWCTTDVWASFGYEYSTECYYQPTIYITVRALATSVA